MLGGIMREIQLPGDGGEGSLLLLSYRDQKGTGIGSREAE